MEQTKSVQTAFRFTEDMMLRIKNKARKLNMSVNAYVEYVLENDLSEKEKAYEEMREFGRKLYAELKHEEPIEGFHWTISEEELENDERAKYILGK